MDVMNSIREFTNESILIQLAIIIASVKLIGSLSDRLGQPTVFEKLLIGIIIGPSMGLFFLFSIFLGKLLIPGFLKWLHRMPVAQGLTAAALVIVFLFAFAAEKSGVANITGAYIAGIIMGTTKFKEEIIEKSEALGYSFLIPVFFVGIGLSAKVNAVTDGFVFIIALSLIAILSKVLGCGAGAKLSGFGWKKSLVVGTGMISRGEIALIIASIGLSKGLIDSSLYTALVIMVLASTVVTPPLLKAVINWSENTRKQVPAK